jgi:hypothetical protein
MRIHENHEAQIMAARYAQAAAGANIGYGARVPHAVPAGAAQLRKETVR